MEILQVSQAPTRVAASITHTNTSHPFASVCVRVAQAGMYMQGISIQSTERRKRAREQREREGGRGLRKRGGKKSPGEGGKYKRRAQEPGKRKRGRAEVSLCSFVPLSLPSRSVVWSPRAGAEGGCGRSGRGAECPFTGVASDFHSRRGCESGARSRQKVSALPPQDPRSLRHICGMRVKSRVPAPILQPIVSLISQRARPFSINISCADSCASIFFRRGGAEPPAAAAPPRRKDASSRLH